MIPDTLLRDVLAQAGRQCAAPGGIEAMLANLRHVFPTIHISICGEDDVPPRLAPAAESDRCLLYYVDAGDHCLKLTNDAEAASGIVVALRDDEE